MYNVFCNQFAINKHKVDFIKVFTGESKTASLSIDNVLTKSRERLWEIMEIIINLGKLK